VAPKKIGVSACGSIISPSLILTCSFVVEREKTVDWVLTWLIWSPQSCVHVCTLFATSCIVLAADVCMEAVGDMSWDNTGDFGDIYEEDCWQNNTPCGTPSLIITLSLRCPSTFTRADLSWRKQRIHLCIRPDTSA